MAETTYYAMTSDEYSKIADAIRTRTGKTGQILGSEFATAISEIDSNDPSYAWNSEEVVINTGAIPDYAFYNNTKIKKVTIGAGVTSIGANAFNGCTALAEVTIGAGVTSIGANAFNGCTALAEVTIGAGVTSIGANAFNNTAITEITIPEGVTSLGIQAFASNSKLATVNFNATNCTVSVDTSYSKGIFQSCAITTFNIGTTVKKIPDRFLEYSNNSGLKSITIPNSVTSIGNYAFRDCTGLTSITIPNSVTSIGNYAFSGCTGLTSITIPNSVTSIKSYTFFGCTGLTSITIGNSVTSIGDYAFQNCTGLTSITIPNSVTSIGQSAFRGCTGLTSITIMGKPYFSDYCFQNTSKVEQLVMKDTTGVPKLSYTSCFQNSTLYNSSSTAKIYVPSNLLASYQTATNWSDATIKAKLTALQDKITIDGTEYASVYGQTWQEWCESENNTDGFVVSGNNILTADKTKFVELVNEKDTDGNITRKTPVLPTDLVIELEHITSAI